MALGLLALAFAGAAVAQIPPSWERPLPPFRIADNLYYVGTEGLSVFLITTPAGHILVDGAMGSSPPLIEASIARLGFRPADVKFILSSHAHYDHAAGIARLKSDTGAQVVAGERDKPALEAGRYAGSEELRAYDFAPVKVDRTVRQGDVVRLGGVAVTAEATPGHTAGCTSWSLPVVIDGKTHRALIYCSTSVAANRLAGGRGPQYPGIVADYRRSFAKLRADKAEVFLALHAEQWGLKDKLAKMKPGAPSPFVDPGELGRVMRASEADFETQLARQTAAAR
jgi:metallo-beta-lactamase class B